MKQFEMGLNPKITYSVVLLTIVLLLYCLTNTNVGGRSKLPQPKLLQKNQPGEQNMNCKSNENDQLKQILEKLQGMNSKSNKNDQLKIILENLQSSVPKTDIGKESSQRNSVLPSNESNRWVKGIGECVPWLPAGVNIKETQIISFPGSGNSFICYMILQATGR